MPDSLARRALVAAGLAALVAVAACDDTGGTTPAIPAAPAATASAPLPAAFLLRNDQMPGYGRSNSRVLRPDILATEANDPALATTLIDQGFLEGAEWTFSPPQPGAPGRPFGQVVTRATIFRDAAGAGRNVETEKQQSDRAPSSGGSITVVTDLPATGVDSLTVYVAETANGAVSGQVFLAIMRRGRVVAELFAGGDPTTATEKNFAALLLLAEGRLATAPA
ncbi:MAG TPA: hypothetical protein VI316_13290 [Candidatus Dormibacteraeota bacterium]